MVIKHYDIEILEKDPFHHCKLDRKKYAEILTNIIRSYPSGFVMAINNRWGAGKTTFVKMWQQSLINHEFKTIYFNAWENDFEDNPMTALMGELSKLSSSKNKNFNSAMKKASAYSRHLAPALIRSLADKYIDTKTLRDALKEFSTGLTAIFEQEVNDYLGKKNNIEEFKKDISNFINEESKDKPIVFIVDELDRCRPDYAVSILEQIKHFFSIPDIVFVLSIDKTQLGNAIKGVYGSEFIDSEEYLRRFIDLEYSIPEPSGDSYYTYLYEYFKFDEFFDSSERKKYRIPEADNGNFLRIAEQLFLNKSIPLRQQEKIFGLARIALRSFHLNSIVVPEIFLFMAFIKITDPKFYEDLKNKTLETEEIQSHFSNHFKAQNDEIADWIVMRTEALLLIFHENYREPEHYKRKHFIRNNKETNEQELVVQSIINPDKKEEFINIILSIYKMGSNISSLDLGYFIDRLELLESLRT